MSSKAFTKVLKCSFLPEAFNQVFFLYLLVVLPDISMIHCASRDISRLLKGLTLTATFTDDILAVVGSPRCIKFYVSATTVEEKNYYFFAKFTVRKQKIIAGKARHNKF